MRIRGLLASSVVLATAVADIAGAAPIWSKLEDLSPDFISPYVQASWFHGGTDLREDGQFLGDPGAMRAMGIELGYQLRDHAPDEGIELGLAYEYSSGFRSRIANYDLRAALHTLPQLSIYGSFKQNWGYPYIGLRTGIVQLANAQVYDSLGKVYGLEASTVQMGLALGVVTKVNFFIEASLELREFKNPNYKLPGEELTVPAHFPRQIHASQFTIAIGYQALKSKKEEDEKPKPPVIKESVRETTATTEKIGGKEVKTEQIKETTLEYKKPDGPKAEAAKPSVPASAPAAPDSTKK